MIFSDDSRKEMLERHLRREGPIFTGDESLIWDRGIPQNLAFELSLARLINHNWFLRGESSKKITLKQILLNQYMIILQQIQKKKLDVIILL